jgi:elongation factor Ts
MNISASLVNELRAKTGAGLMDCKKALIASNANLEEAINVLRTKGLSSAAKKADREAKEGLVIVINDSSKYAIAEFRCETDFVAKNEQFQLLAKNITSHILQISAKNVEEVLETKIKNDVSVKEYIFENIATLGENLSIKKLATLDSNLVFVYLHNKYSDSIGKIAVLVELDSDLTYDVLKELGQKIAMHVAAMKPLVLDINQLDPILVENEKNIFSAQAKESGKPDAVIAKMVEGRVRKFYEESVLNEQVSMFDGKTKIKDLVQEYALKLGGKIAIKSYIRFEVGE